MSLVSFAPISVLNVIANDVYSQIKLKGADTFASFRLTMETGFSSYAKNKSEKLKWIKTIISPNVRHLISDLYVEPRIIDSSGDIFSADAIYNKLSDGGAFLVDGPAGIGKSTFLKSVFLRFCSVNYGLLPFFVELRDIDVKGESLLKILHNDFELFGAQISYDLFRKIVRSGKVIVLFDGFDEIDPILREKAVKILRALYDENPGISIVITSRPTEMLRGWHELQEFQLSKLNKAETLAVIAKSPIDLATKESFTNRVEKVYYSSHKQFLCNPLLCYMMLLTYAKGGEIPEQIHLFYKRAFEVLIREHDETKFLYRRKLHSDIVEDEFVALWNAFCFFSYVERRYIISQELMIYYAKSATEFKNSRANIEALIMDFCESIGIIVRDGDVYNFLHRSFQEYGAAAFMCGEDLSDKSKIFDMLRKRYEDNWIRLCFLINREMVEQEFVIPKINSILTAWHKKRRKSRFYSMYSEISYETRLLPYEESSTEESSGFAFTINEKGLYWDIRTIFRLYNKRIMRRTSDLEDQELLDTLRPYSHNESVRALEVNVSKIPDSVFQSGFLRERIDYIHHILVDILSDADTRRRRQDSMISAIIRRRPTA